MTAPALRGVFPPLVTPFHDDGSIDADAFRGNLERYEQVGLAGYVVLGSNGEAVALNHDERLALVAAARAATRRPLIAGTGLDSTAATIELTRRAADAGADAALVLTPYYYRGQMSVDALRRHFEAVADAARIPVLIYSVPAFTALPFPAALAEQLGGHPGIAGMKESSGDVALLGEVIRTTPPSFAALTGSAPALYPSLCVGAAGGILALACCAPEAVVALVDAFDAGDHARAAELQGELLPLALAVTRQYGVAGLKAAMDAAGLAGGAVRAPLLPVGADARAEIAALVARTRERVTA